MFEFYGVLARRRFLLAAALRIALFLASVVAFPHFLVAVAAVTDCHRIGGACGAVGVITAMAYKPLAFVLFVFSFIGISLRRTRDIGVPGWIGMFIPLLFAADQTFFTMAGAPGSLPLLMGARAPSYALLGLACTAALCALPARDDGSGNPFGRAGQIAFALGLFVAAHAILAIVSSFPAAREVVSAARALLSTIGVLLPYAMVSLVALLAWIAWRERDHTIVTRARVRPRAAGVPTATAPDLPIRSLLAAALGLTIVTSALVLPFWPIALLTQSTTIIVPTFLMYLCVVSALFVVVQRRSVAAFTLLALSLVPFAYWGYAHWATAKENEREAAEVAAIPTTRLARIPPTIVVESPQVRGVRASWKIAGIESVIQKGAYGSKLMQFDRPVDRRPARPRAVEAPPDEHLLLKIGRSSSFAKRQRNYGTTGGPLELRFVNPQRDELVAVWYRSFNPPPARLPLLTTSGWFRGANSATTEEIEAGIDAFLDNALRSSG